MSIKNKILIVCLVTAFFCCRSRRGDSCIGTIVNKQGYNYYIEMLDSAVRHNKSDTIDCCSGAIRYMEMTTSIDASSPGNFFGKFFFLRMDYLKWKHWGDTSKIYKKQVLQTIQ